MNIKVSSIIYAHKLTFDDVTANWVTPSKKRDMDSGIVSPNCLQKCMSLRICGMTGHRWVNFS